MLISCYHAVKSEEGYFNLKAAQNELGIFYNGDGHSVVKVKEDMYKKIFIDLIKIGFLKTNNFQEATSILTNIELPLEKTAFVELVSKACKMSGSDEIYRYSCKKIS